MKIKLLIYLLITFHSLTYIIIADEGFEYNINSNIGVHNDHANFQNLPGLTQCCNNFNSNQYFYNGFSLNLNYFINNNFLIGSAISINQLDGFFNYFETEIINVDGNAVSGKIEHLIELSSIESQIELIAGYKIYDNLYLTALFGLSGMRNLDLYQSEILREPKDMGSFKEDSSRIRNELSSNNLTSDYLFGGGIGLDYYTNINKSKTLFIKFSTEYKNYFIGEYFDNIDWQSSNLIFSFGISYIPNGINIFKQEVEELTPEIDLFYFIKNNNKETSIQNNKFNLETISANELNTNNKYTFLKKTEKLITIYPYIKYINRENLKLQINNSVENIFISKLDTLESKISLSFNKLYNPIPNELNFTILNTNNKVIYSKKLSITKTQSNEINFALYDSTQDVIEFLKNNSNKNNIQLYSNDTEIYKEISKLGLTNLTIYKTEELPYLHPILNLHKYIIIFD